MSVPHIAENILPGHPDRLADAIVESLVDAAVAHDPEALVGVEAAVHRKKVFVTGRIAAGPPGSSLQIDLTGIVHGVFRNAGYTGRWEILPEVLSDLDLGPLDDDERGIRQFSDDQNIIVGHAEGNKDTGYLPPACYVAGRLREVLSRVREEHADRLGPDGKLLVRFLESEGEFAWERCNVSIQHVPETGYEELHRPVLPAFESGVQLLKDKLPGLHESWDPEKLRLNGAGIFSCGGPNGDNGLSGKKLIVDHFGPCVPIGGGALCGKDPHKVDRVGALRARQIAVALVRDRGVREATVFLSYLPGEEKPDFVSAKVDGEWWDVGRIQQAIPLPDLSIEGSFRNLELGEVRWVPFAQNGFFGAVGQWG